jgi:hypothetical protein
VLGSRNIVLHNLEHLKPHKITSCRPMGERRYRAVFRESGDYVSLTTNSIEGTYQNAICASVPCGRKASSAGSSIPSCWLHESRDHCFGIFGIETFAPVMMPREDRSKSDMILRRRTCGQISPASMAVTVMACIIERGTGVVSEPGRRIDRGAVTSIRQASIAVIKPHGVKLMSITCQL